MSSVHRLVTVVVLGAGLLACQDGHHYTDAGPRAQALSDSIERGYERLQRAYDAVKDSLSPPSREMVGALGRMHGQMRPRHGQGRRGMQGRGRMHEQRRRRRGRGTRGAEMREWHHQMMAMHTEMARMHEQSGRADLAARHQELRQRHRKMRETYASAEETTTARQTEDGPDVATVDGASLYGQHCATCHGREGQGLGPFPPLAGASWVTGEVDVPIRILLSGLRGAIEIRGRTYDSVMPAFGSRLRDEEVAAILTYVRSSWGNEAESVEPKEVRTLRARSADRTQPWTPAELEETEN